MQVRRAAGQASGSAVLTDALKNDQFLSWLLDAIEVRLVSKGTQGEIRASYTDMFQTIRSQAGNGLRPRLLKGEQSNSSIAYGDRLILKLFRRVEEGVNPDLEIGLFLTEKARFPNVPPVAGSIEYRASSGAGMTIGILQGFVPNQGDAWTYTLHSLEGFWEKTASYPEGPPALAAEDANPVLRYDGVVPKVAADLIGPYLEKIELLGKRTAEMHLALASDSRDPAFAPEPFTDSFLQRSGRLRPRTSLSAIWGCFVRSWVNCLREPAPRPRKFWIESPQFWKGLALGPANKHSEPAFAFMAIIT